MYVKLHSLFRSIVVFLRFFSLLRGLFVLLLGLAYSVYRTASCLVSLGCNPVCSSTFRNWHTQNGSVKKWSELRDLIEWFDVWWSISKLTINKERCQSMLYRNIYKKKKQQLHSLHVLRMFWDVDECCYQFILKSPIILTF